MGLSVKTYSILMLMLGLFIILSMFFVLIIVPILPLDEENIVLQSFTQTPVLVFAALCGLLFCGSLSGFTIFVMGRGKWKTGFETERAKLK